MAKNPKIASVDIQQLLANSTDFIELKKAQNIKALELQSWTNAMNAEIAKQSTQEDKNKMAQQGQAQFQQKQQAINVEHHQKMLGLDAKLTEVVANIAKEEKYDYVFAKGTVIFGATDITQDVIKKIKS